MSEEELNQELKVEEIKDVSGGFEAKVGGQVQAKWANRITTDTSPDSGKEGKKNTNYDCQDLSGN